MAGSGHEKLREYREEWQRKPALRAIYNDYYRRIRNWARPGKSLEIGGGVGNLKASLDDIVSTDIQYAPWLDAVADAQRLPFGNASFVNIIMFDVLHHIERPRLFFAEVDRILKPGGRLIVVEPDITPVSRVCYRLFHPEPVDLDADPLEDGEVTPGRDPYAANQAVPTLLFGLYRSKLEAHFPRLRLIAHEHIGLLAYPLSGGFRSWSLIPAWAVSSVLKIEDLLAPVVGRFMAFRLFVVIERQ